MLKKIINLAMKTSMKLKDRFYAETTRFYHQKYSRKEEMLSVDDYLKLSRQLCKASDFLEAEKALARGKLIYPHCSQLYIEYAEIAMQNNEWEAAINRWLDALSLFNRHHSTRLAEVADALKAKAGWQESRACNLCGCPLFSPVKSRKNKECLRCLSCGSIERTRLLYLHLQLLNLPRTNSKVLHMAPEQGLYSKISNIVSKENYILADIDPERYNFTGNVKKIDLCQDLENIPDNFFDLIIHIHVIEHLPCNYTYVLKHIHRILKGNGMHICIIPFLPGNYDECYAVSAEEAERRFGGTDHVRRFGTKDIQRTIGRVIKIESDYDAEKLFGPDKLRVCNIPEPLWKGLTTSTVLVLRKNDYLL